MDIKILSGILTSFFLTYFVIPPIVRVSNIKNLFDVPNERKLNKVVVPTLGGMAIFLGLSISSILFLPRISLPELRYLSAAIIMMFFVGLKDDIMVISAKKKLAIQLAAALILVIFGNFRIVHAYGIGSLDQIPDWLSFPLSVLVILFIINAINLIDGIDGLAAGITLLASTALGCWFYLSGNSSYALACLALSGSLLAFLRFNLWGGKNKIFMGDTGSLILGIFLAAMMVRFSELNCSYSGIFHLSQAPLIGLALLIVPITDTLRVFIIRLWHKRSPFSPDMNHFHHLLIRFGLTHIQASSFLVTYTIFFFLLGLTLQKYISITYSFTELLALSFSTVGLFYLRLQRIEIQRSKTETENSKTKTIKLETWQKVRANNPKMDNKKRFPPGAC